MSHGTLVIRTAVPGGEWIGEACACEGLLAVSGDALERCGFTASFSAGACSVRLGAARTKRGKTLSYVYVWPLRLSHDAGRAFCCRRWGEGHILAIRES